MQIWLVHILVLCVSPFDETFETFINRTFENGFCNFLNFDTKK